MSTLPVNKQTSVNATGGPVTMTLPTGSPGGAQIVVTKSDASTNVVSVTGSIRGATSTLSLQYQFESLTFTADSAGSWWPTANHLPKAVVDQKITALNLGTASTHPASDFDPAGAASAAQTNAINAAATSAASTYATLAQALMDWALTQSFQLVTATRDANEAITTASVVWPDGATGTFTADTKSTAFPGAIDAYHVTHVLGGVTKTITQTAVTRDAGGAVTAQPALTVA